MGLESLDHSTVYFDANTFIYAIEDHEDYRAPIRRLFEHLSAHRCQIVSSELTYAECLVKPLKVRDEASIKNYESHLIDSGSVQLMPVTLNVLRHAAILRAHHTTKLPDAIHVATAIDAGCSHLISNDRKLPTVNGIELLFLKEIGH